MSRREDRYSGGSRRHRARFYHQPSPKRSRRDARPEAERVGSRTNVNSAEPGEKRSRWLQDASSHEMPLQSDRKGEGVSLNKDSNPSEVPRPRSYFQRGERGAASHGGRSSSRRANSERGWWKDSRGRGSDRVENQELQQREETSRKGDGYDSKVWRHDGFFEMVANRAPPPPPNQRRPVFGEQNVGADHIQNDQNGKNEDLKANNEGKQVSDVERREGRGGYNNRYLDRFEKSSPRGGGRSFRRDEQHGGGFASRDRYAGGNGRESNSGQQTFSSDGVRVEKWKHDLYKEANESAPPKNDEDQLAKIEALLAS